MKENGRENQQPEIIREWRTREINPQEIAEALRGTLKRTADNNSMWEIDLNYGETDPLLTIKGHINKRNMFLVVNAPLARRENANRCVVSSSNIEELHFVQYNSPFTNQVETDMAVYIRDSGTDLNAGGMVISSYAHQSRF